jgi:phosphatidylglycerophosphatase A
MPPRPSFRDLVRHPAHWFAFGGGAGLAPKAPGTVGSLVALPIYYFLFASLSVPFYLLLVAVLFLFGVWICARTERDLGVHDHSGIVWDEIVGQLVALFMLPHGWLWMLAGFGLFRLFDIWKPFPISWLNAHVKGGWGIMLDDLAAGIAAVAILQVSARIHGF